MPFSSASAASSTARWGTDTSRTRSARSSTDPSSQPDSGKRVLVLVADAVGQPSVWRRQRRGRRCPAVPCGVSERDGGVDLSCSVLDLKAESALRLFFGVVRRHELSLDHHRSAAWRGDENVRLQGGLADDLPGVFVQDGVAGQHSAQPSTESVVRAGLCPVGRGGHVTISPGIV